MLTQFNVNSLQLNTSYLEEQFLSSLTTQRNLTITAIVLACLTFLVSAYIYFGSKKLEKELETEKGKVKRLGDELATEKTEHGKLKAFLESISIHVR